MTAVSVDLRCIKMKFLITIFITLFFISLELGGQNISPQVLNSAGKEYPNGINNMYFADNIGEPFTNTLSNNNFIVTQGFLQPDLVSTAGPIVSVLKNNISCSDKKDGKISVAISNIPANHQVNYFWIPSSLCPSNSCSSLDSLNSGTYTVMIVITNLSNLSSDTLKPAPIVVNDANGPCLVKVFNGVTPNGDGENDVWTIENISEFPSNQVSIYNRWGAKVYETKGYDNNSNSWPEKNTHLQGSTYFYVIELGNGSPAIKGWIEVITN
jgi:gliding motility-associated-like protein